MYFIMLKPVFSPEGSTVQNREEHTIEALRIGEDFCYEMWKNLPTQSQCGSYILLAGLPGFARDHCSIIMSINAFYS